MVFSSRPDAHFRFKWLKAGSKVVLSSRRNVHFHMTGYLRVILSHLGDILGYLGAIWGHLGAILGHLGTILGHLGGILGHLGVILGKLGFILGGVFVEAKRLFLRFGG